MSELSSRSLSDFVGAWRLEKVIRQQDGMAGRFAGEAVWDAAGNYCEHGLLHFGDGPGFRAERRYIWRAPLAVYFEDGRFFHDVPPLGGTAHHDCAPDTYRVVYDFATWPNWRALWTVTGPRKSYEMICSYSPLRD